MEKEKDILMILADNNDISQRDLAQKAGISLGTVNSLLKKCVKKGLLKIERLNSRNLKYILTPAGMKEKMKRTLSYVKRSYKAIIKLQEEIYQLACKEDKAGREICIWGPEDEIAEIVEYTLTNKGIDYFKAANLKELNKYNEKQISVLYWKVADVNFTEYKNFKYINLISEINLDFVLK